MKRKAALFLCVFICCFSVLLPSDQTKKELRSLNETYRKWLEEEVVYIITPKEKEVFLQLETDRERNIFIDAFWKQREPSPNTPENEFKLEHYRRISYANQWFGRDVPGAGWRTDMGRIYIILGEPKNIEKHENLRELYPVIIWFYDGLVEYGLPNAFNVVFFKRDGAGSYILYSPIKYGPQQLMPNYNGDMTDYEEAYNQLVHVSPSVSSVSLSLIPGEAGYILTPSLASEILISQKIPSAPHEKVKDTYAEKLLKYKDVIEVEYTTNYIDCDSLVQVIQDPSGIFFVHYLIEPTRLTFEEYEGKFRSHLVINGQVADPNGRTIYQFDREVPIEFNRDQMASIQNKLFSFQDLFPLVAGKYKFYSLIKNSVSKEFTSVEADITIPEPSVLRMSPLLLANRLDRKSKYEGQNKPFLINNNQLVPSPRNDFTTQDTVYLYFQIQGLTQDIKDSASLDYAIWREEEKVHSVHKSITDYEDSSNIVEEFSLSDYPPSYYRIDVSLVNSQKEEILSEDGHFFITHQAYLPRAWVLSLPLPASEDPSVVNILGNQLLNKNNIQEAKPLLEKAYREYPVHPKYALDFCRVLFMNNEYQEVKQAALPLLNDEGKYPFLQLMGQTSQALGEFSEAITYYKDYLSYYGTNIVVLNALGECYYQVGDSKAALAAWEKSLEISPDQERIKTRIKSIKENK